MYAPASAPNDKGVETSEEQTSSPELLVHERGERTTKRERKEAILTTACVKFRSVERRGIFKITNCRFALQRDQEEEEVLSERERERDEKIELTMLSVG